MKLATILTFPFLLYTSLGNTKPPFYYGSTVQVIDRESIYYKCTGKVSDWAQGGIEVSELCDDFLREVLKVEQLEVIRNRGEKKGL